MQSTIQIQPRQVTALRFLIANDQPFVPRTPTELRLHQYCEELIARSHRANLPVQFLQIMPLPDGPVLHRGETTDVMLLDCANDPLFHDPDGFPVPQRVLKGLRRIQRSGVAFDTLYIAHEVLRGSVPSDGPIPAAALMPPPSRAVMRRSRQFGDAATTLWGWLGRFTQWLTPNHMKVRQLAEEARRIDWDRLLDPIILRVVTGSERPPRPGDPAVWFYVTHWVYGEEA
jgi:hypothetical protein